MRHDARTAFLAAALIVSTASWTHAQSCSETFHDPATGDPTTLSVLITAPVEGSSVRSFGPSCPLRLAGIASTVGIPPEFDFYLIVDVSGSTQNGSGVDVDGDGVINGDGDSILDAEVAAARAFVEAVDLTHSSVAIVTFSNSAELAVPLTSDLAALRDALATLDSDGRTNYAAPLSIALDEQQLHHHPGRDQVILFLSDGFPNERGPWPPGGGTCPGFDDPACQALLWCDEAARRGIVVDTFGVGMGAAPDVLAEMARRGGGSFFMATTAGAILDILPAVVHVGVQDVLVENVTTGEARVVVPGPDGRFQTTFTPADGRNDLRVTARASAFPSFTTTCTTHASVTCLDWGCPASLAIECAAGGGRAPSWAPWASGPVDIAHDSLHADAAGADASGLYPIGRTRVTWTLSADGGASATCVAEIDVADSSPPDLRDVPPDAVVSCPHVPARVDPVAVDGCDPSPSLAFDEIVEPGPCPDSYDVVRTWTATDSTGRATVATQRVQVRDDSPPRLVGVPADADVPCPEVPELPVVTAEDDCDPSPPVAFAEERIDGPCPGTYELRREWSAVDRCGHAAVATQVVRVSDVTPPEVRSHGRVICLWPPRHEQVELQAADFGLVVSDACGLADWRFVGCVSSQAEDALGDGSTGDDCAIAADGRSVLVRAERRGRGDAAHEGRRYRILVEAVDSCGLSSGPVEVGVVAVPHDRSDHDRTCAGP